MTTTTMKFTLTDDCVESGGFAVVSFTPGFVSVLSMKLEVGESVHDRGDKPQKVVAVLNLSLEEALQLASSLQDSVKHQVALQNATPV